MLKLNSLFQEGAVFQQKKIIPIWGKTEKSSKLAAEFAGKIDYAMSSSDGNFMFRLAPVEAGGPFTLKVTNLESGETITVKDILVGEVWIASGQSNMQYTLGQNSAVIPPDDENFELSGINTAQCNEFCSTTKNTDKLRFFHVNTRHSGMKEENAEGQWEYMTPDNVPACTAVGAWFARYIQENLNVPVGIIASSLGGTIAEAWTSRNGLLRNPETCNLITAKDNTFRSQKAWDTECANSDTDNLKYADPGNEGFGKGWANPDFNDRNWHKMQVPGSWIRQEIAGNGAVWGRKKVNIPESWCGKELQLKLGGIDKTDITYFNGVEVGRTGKGMDTSCWNTLRNYTVPAELVKPGENVIAVRAYSFYYDGAFGGIKKNYAICCGDESIPLFGDWQAYSEFDLGNISPSAIDMGPRNANVPSILFDGMINPLLPYAMRGVIWYQGESNAVSPADSRSYYSKLKTMIEDWRYLFEQGDFPFIQVQLANYYRGNDDVYDKFSSWAVLRDAQRKLCNDMKNVYMASAIDIGEFYDIHPQDKKSVGKRLADNALCNVYNHPEIVPFGPLFQSFAIEDNKIRINFRYGEGLYLKEGTAQSFYIAGSGGGFVAADKVEIDGSSVLVSSEKIADPCYVRYAWSDYPVSTLYNSADLPASSFSTSE